MVRTREQLKDGSRKKNFKGRLRRSSGAVRRKINQEPREESFIKKRVQTD